MAEDSPRDARWNRPQASITLSLGPKYLSRLDRCKSDNPELFQQVKRDEGILLADPHKFLRKAKGYPGHDETVRYWVTVTKITFQIVMSYGEYHIDQFIRRRDLWN